MPGFRPFGYKGLPGTCLWCGFKLRYERVTASESDKDDPTYKQGDPYGSPSVRAKKSGRYWDGLFCGLGCGYRFGVRMGELGHRLEEKS